MSEWIDVKERLPGCLVPVITTNGKRVTQTYRTSDDDVSWAAWSSNEVTHWMPLPKPPTPANLQDTAEQTTPFPIERE